MASPKTLALRYHEPMPATKADGSPVPPKSTWPSSSAGTLHIATEPRLSRRQKKAERRAARR